LNKRRDLCRGLIIVTLDRSCLSKAKTIFFSGKTFAQIQVCGFRHIRKCIMSIKMPRLFAKWMAVYRLNYSFVELTHPNEDPKTTHLVRWFLF